MSDKNGELDQEIRNHALYRLGGVDEAIRTWAVSHALPMCTDLPGYAKSATTAELTAALRCPGVTVGSHSWSHPNLTALDIMEVSTEARRSREWLRSRFGDRTVDWFAYPYGLNSRQTQIAVADASYRGALRVSGGWHSVAEVSPFARPRLNVAAGLTVDNLRGRLQGALLS